MSVASPALFTKEHIESHAFAASHPLAEQAIHCLELVAELSWANLSFQFKGGNSLLMILQDPKRFSIDVDIATDETVGRIEESLDKIVAECGVFAKWTKRQHKTKPWIALSSYYLFYKSHYVKEEDAFVMLDAQLTRSPYATRDMPVVCGGLFSTVIKAEVPLPSSLIGDKLLTLGPGTLGIPLGKGKEAQRLKHVFDVSLLIATGPALSKIRESFAACVHHENKLQRKEITAAQLLSDTILFCKSVVEHEQQPRAAEGNSPVLAENIKGLPDFAAHLFTKGYSWPELRRDMARVGLCIAAVCSPGVSDAAFAEALKKYGNDAKKCWDTAMAWVDQMGKVIV
jgi:hypothetical protein